MLRGLGHAGLNYFAPNGASALRFPDFTGSAAMQTQRLDKKSLTRDLLAILGAEHG